MKIKKFDRTNLKKNVKAWVITFLESISCDYQIIGMNYDASSNELTFKIENNKKKYDKLVSELYWNRYDTENILLKVIDSNYTESLSNGVFKGEGIFKITTE